MKRSALFLAFVLIASSVLGSNSYIHHELEVFLNPEQHYIEVKDTFMFPEGTDIKMTSFYLNCTLEANYWVSAIQTEVVRDVSAADDVSFLNVLSYSPWFDQKTEDDTSLNYKGTIYHPIEQEAEEYARSFSQTPGIICEDGVYLSGSSYWVPYFNDELITFSMTVSLPEGWDAVSQGERTRHEVVDGRRIVRWESLEPTEDVHLVAAPFTEYSRKAGNVDVMAFLRTPDEGLANKYIETTEQYLKMYEDLIGPYPYSKFALVENFWETGYGMASFTLLGQQVIRFPFILHSSYPHELLHNWWGNSVFVDYDSGNWCEGITAYMADHLIKEQRGQGESYRRSTLQKYTDYVRGSKDFPLTEFRSRHDASSEAVGYGKSLMFFNMLREDVGDEKFVEGFQKFYADNRYEFASFDDIRTAFEEVTGEDLKPFFKQWTERTGAPELRPRKCLISTSRKGGFTVKVEIEQVQEEKPFSLTIPVFFRFNDRVEVKKIQLDKRKQVFKFKFNKLPNFIEFDPQYNVFRKLNQYEVPPSLSKIFGSEDILILLPSKADEKHLKNYKELGDLWSKDGSKNIEVKMDSEVSELPTDRPVWVFGLENKFSGVVTKGLEGYSSKVEEGSVKLENFSTGTDNNSIVAAVRHPGNPDSVVVLLNIDNSRAASGLSRKLPHYGKYSYLVFEGDEPSNIAKGTWPAVGSFMRIVLDNTVTELPELPKRPALAELAPLFSADRMMKTVNYLSSPELEGRGTGTAGIKKAALYIEEQFSNAGLRPHEKDSNFFQSWEGVIGKDGKKGLLENVIAVLPGTKESMQQEAVVLCAHYDHLGYGWPDVKSGNEGKIHPGADDNASGIAVLLELAETLGKSLKPDRTIIFAAFTGEENGLTGSEFFLKNCRYKITSALNLDTVGRLNDGKIMVINGNSASEWKHIFMGVGYVTGVEAEMIFEDLDSSDQKSFIDSGVPAVQLFTGPHLDYHTPGDTADKIDEEGLVKVAAFTKETLLYLAEREEPLSFSGSDKPAHSGHPGGHPEHGSERKATTGSMPDFSFSGPGVKIGEVPEGSPAEKADLQKGDVILSIDGKKIENLRSYSGILKLYKTGDEVELVYQRDGQEQKTEIILGER